MASIALSRSRGKLQLGYLTVDCYDYSLRRREESPFLSTSRVSMPVIDTAL
jgi:hypothetical protein